MTSISTILGDIKNRPALLSFLLIATLVASLCFAFQPRWETNDDAAMSMIAHGYGLAAYGSPNLVFSNVLWGHLVRVMPTINGVLGYSIATLAVLLVIGWTLLYFLLRLGVDYRPSLLAVALIIVRPTLFPQFTINAGLLTAVAIIGWHVYARFKDTGILVIACMLAFFGFLIRNTEFLLVLGVALPLLPWRSLKKRREMQIAFLLTGVAISSAAAFDRWAYSGPEWRQFLEFNEARIPYTDYGADKHLLQHPEIMTSYGYSQNDISLLSAGFFDDPQIAAPQTLNAMLAKLGPLFLQEGSAESGLKAIKAPFVTNLLPLFLSALVLFVWAPRWSVAIAWILCLTALFAMGIMGRPGIVRVYAPLVSLLLTAPFLHEKNKGRVPLWLATLTLFIACVWNAYLLIPEKLASQRWLQQIQTDALGLPVEPIVSWEWGGDVEFESIFPLLANNLDTRKLKFYGLDSFNHAPFSVANTEQIAGRGFSERLRTTAGIPIVALPNHLKMINIYCREHFNGQLHRFIKYQARSLQVQQIRCEANE
jgi:hypothetical protein